MIKCVNYLLKSNTPLTRQPRAFIFSFFKKEKELKPEENKTDEALILKEDWTPLGKHMNELKK